MFTSLWVNLLISFDFFSLVDKVARKFSAYKRGLMHAYTTPTGKVRIILMIELCNTWIKRHLERLDLSSPFYARKTYVRLLHSSHDIVCQIVFAAIQGALVNSLVNLCSLHSLQCYILWLFFILCRDCMRSVMMSWWCKKWFWLVILDALVNLENGS